MELLASDLTPIFKQFNLQSNFLITGEFVHIPGSDRPFPLATSGLPSKHWDKCILERDHFDVIGKVIL